MTSEGMTPEERIELAALLEEEWFRRDRLTTARVKKVIAGVEQTIVVVKLKLRPPYTMEEHYDA
jgi:hypothetical protein